MTLRPTLFLAAWACAGAGVPATPAAPTPPAGLTVHDLGKSYEPDPTRTPPAMMHDIARRDDVTGGNTSIRHLDAEHLPWKSGSRPDPNGSGYYQRNRDLGQVFHTPPGASPLRLAALVIRTARGNNAVMAGAPGAPLMVQFFDVLDADPAGPRIDDNGTPPGSTATHGFDTRLHRADDFVRGVTYRPLGRWTGGRLPDTFPTTDRYVYDRGDGEPFGEQDGHLRFLRLEFAADAPPVLAPGRRYAFLVGFAEAGPARGLGLACSTATHSPAPPAFVTDALGLPRWGVRREGDGTLPPTMIGDAAPPAAPGLRARLQRESLFAPDHWDRLPPTSDGYPDVDTYRTLQFYLELAPAP